MRLSGTFQGSVVGRLFVKHICGWRCQTGNLSNLKSKPCKLVILTRVDADG